MRRAARRGFRSDRRGLALIEFAYAMPILMVLGLMGAEVASMGTTKMRLSQTTLTAADNASRLGIKTPLNVRQLFESDLNDVFAAADRQARGMDLYQRGRVIISSVQKDGSGRQFIKWQRCRGMKAGVASRFGPEGTTAGDSTSPLPGFVASGRDIKAPTNGAVIIVESAYDYRPVTGTGFSQVGPTTMRSEAFFTVRDNRDLSQVYNTPGTPVASCATLTP